MLRSEVPHAFDVLSWELELVGARCIFLDNLTGKLLGAVAPELRKQLLEGVQAVDLLSQHVTGLSSFSRQLSQCEDTFGIVDVASALKTITLGAMADRMTTSFGGVESGLGDGDGAGELDLF